MHRGKRVTRRERKAHKALLDVAQRDPEEVYVFDDPPVYFTGGIAEYIERIAETLASAPALKEDAEARRGFEELICMFRQLHAQGRLSLHRAHDLVYGLEINPRSLQRPIRGSLLRPLVSTRSDEGSASEVA